MKTVRHLASIRPLLSAVCITLLTSDVAATPDAPVSAWAKGFHNEARLIAGTADQGEGQTTFAGLEISMPPGWKTYWRTPGEAGGIPPEFDWSASENLATATVMYPAPSRLTDKSGTVLGYQDRAVFPVRIAPTDSAKPIELRLKVNYGVCKDICVPAEADLSLSVPAQLVAASSVLQMALDAVPRRQPRAGVDPVLRSLSIAADGSKLMLEVSDPTDGSTDAIVEAPDGLYLPLPELTASSGGRSIFQVPLGGDGTDFASIKGKALTVTLIGAKGQSETTITVQ